jgi:hypothetical protein
LSSFGQKTCPARPHSAWSSTTRNKEERITKETTYKLGKQELSIGAIRRNAARHAKRARYASEDIVIFASSKALFVPYKDRNSL